MIKIKRTDGARKFLGLYSRKFSGFLLNNALVPSTENPSDFTGSIKTKSRIMSGSVYGMPILQFNWFRSISLEVSAAGDAYQSWPNLFRGTRYQCHISI